MAPPNIEWRDAVTPFAPVGGADLDLGKVPPAGSSSTFTFRLYNDFDLEGLDTARDLSLIPQARIPAIHGDEWQAEGVDLLDRGAIKIRSPTISGLSAFVPVGTNNGILIPDLDSGEFHEFDIKLELPVGSPEVVTFFKLAIGSTRFLVIGNAFAMDPGIYRGIGRGAQAGGTAVFSRSGAITVSGLDALELPDYAWLHEGIPHSELDHDDTISNSDSAASALLTTESYLFIAVADAVAVTVVKGLKGVGRSFPDDAPATPAGTVLLGWGERFADVDAINLDFTELDGATPKFFAVETSGLAFTIKGGGGTMVSGGQLKTPTSDTAGNLTASSTNTVQLLADGSAAVTLDGSPAAPNAQFLADIVTDGSDETSRVERRRWADRAETFEFTWTEPNNPSQATTEVQAFNPTSRNLWIASDQLMLQVENIAGTTGAVIVDVFIKEPDVAAVTLFTSSGSDDRRPTILPSPATNLAFGLPEVLKIPPRSALVAVISITGDMTGDWAVLGFTAYAD